MRDAGEIARFRDRCSVFMGELLGVLQPFEAPQSFEDHELTSEDT